MSKRRLLAVIAALGILGLTSMGGSAQGAGFNCQFAFDLLLSPGMGSQPSAGSAQTEGESGTFNCSGYQGSLGLDGRYGPLACATGGTGTGVLSATFGIERFSDNVALRFDPLSNGSVAGMIEGARVSGSFALTPTEGDCGRSPITRGAVRGEAVVRPPGLPGSRDHAPDRR